MMKKLIGVAAGAGLVLTMAGAAFASGPWWSKPKLEVNNNANVTVRTLNVANTGLNKIGGYKVFGGEIHTGDAGAAVLVANDINATEVGCGCYKKVEINNGATVSVGTLNVANTGLNKIGGYKVFGGEIHTGDAGAEVVVANMVNTTLVGGAI